MFDLLEESKIDIAIFPVLLEMGMIREIIGFGVLKHKESALLKYIMFENAVGNRSQLLELIRWVRVNKIESGRATGYESEYISSDYLQVMNPKQLACRNNEVLLCMSHFYSRNFSGSSRYKLQSDASCTCKKVEHIHSLKIHAVLKEIE